MEPTIRYAGLDVHKKTITVAVATEGTGGPRPFRKLRLLRGASTRLNGEEAASVIEDTLRCPCEGKHWRRWATTVFRPETRSVHHFFASWSDESATRTHRKAKNCLVNTGDARW